MAPAVSRLLVFTGASLALHALTLSAYGPAGTVSPAYGGPPTARVLQAVLAPLRSEPVIDESQARDSSSPSQQEAPPREPAPAIEPPRTTPGVEQTIAKAEARGGAPDGVAIPFPDKWYMAAELDVRAEPLTPVRLAYPAELAGSGIPGRVRIALFIDERGVVRKTEIVASQPERLFDEAAVKGWEEVRFSPAMKGGLAVKSEKLLELDFQP